MKAANEATPDDSTVAVTFDTLTAAQELRDAGFEGRHAEAVVTTINKAMSETVATKADLALLRADFKLLVQSIDSRFDKVDLKFEAIDNKFEVLETSLRREMETLQDKIVIKLGALMVTMAFLLLALGPFYFRWVMSLYDSGVGPS